MASPKLVGAPDVPQEILTTSKKQEERSREAVRLASEERTLSGRPVQLLLAVVLVVVRPSIVDSMPVDRPEPLAQSLQTPLPQAQDRTVVDLQLLQAAALLVPLSVPEWLARRVRLVAAALLRPCRLTLLVD